MVSRCFPDGYNVKLYISRGRLAWWLLAFLHSESLSSSKYTKMTEVNLSAFVYRVFHEDFSPIVGTFIFKIFFFVSSTTLAEALCLPSSTQTQVRTHDLQIHSPHTANWLPPMHRYYDKTGRVISDERIASDHDSTFHVPEMSVLTTRPSGIVCICLLDCIYLLSVEAFFYISRSQNFYCWLWKSL